MQMFSRKPPSFSGMASINARLVVVEVMLKNLMNNFAELKDDTSAIRLRVDALQEGLRLLGAKVDAQGERLGAKIDARGEQLNAKMDAQGQQLNAKIDAQGAQLNAKIDAQGAQLSAKIETQGEILNGRIVSQGMELKAYVQACMNQQTWRIIWALSLVSSALVGVTYFIARNVY